MMKQGTMASMAISTSSTLLVTLLVFQVASPSQGQVQTPPTLSFCGPLFLPLAACAPFVQGTAQAPGQSCCDNLNQLYGLQPKCLCLVLGDTPISNVFPINRTLALELPSLCSLKLTTSTCSGPSAVAKSPSSQVSLGTNNNSSTSATASPPLTTQMPRGGHTVVGLGLARSDSIADLSSKTHVMFIALLGPAVYAFTRSYL